MISTIDGIRASLQTAALYGDEPAERTGPVGPFGTAEERDLPGVPDPKPEVDVMSIPARGLHGPDLLNEMLTMMISHAQLPAVIRALQAGNEMQRSLVDLRA